MFVAIVLQVFEGGDSDVEYPGDMENSATKLKVSNDLYAESEKHTVEEQGNTYVEEEDDNHRDSSLSGSLLPWGSIASPPASPKLGVSGSGPSPGLGSAKSVNKSNGSVSTIKRPSLWNRNSVSWL